MQHSGLELSLIFNYPKFHINVNLVLKKPLVRQNHTFSQTIMLYCSAQNVCQYRNYCTFEHADFDTHY